ncbi:hypothetical protein NDN01_03875 [Sphingomonas sp. QA11]|uniref:hypothetical protein n=1 Tax=Sphingomonas sp. QA11 TaxID=2950605 RepID=UPI00234A749F|nr:hypothetical protein [Sphingomonas sp. QA11]WCM28075.1 hypothetical protein NDN01_03875 [Sphingomonas sp. QA11]
MKLILLAALAVATPAMAQDMSTSQTTSTTAADPVGGYQPSQPALSGTPQPGVKPVFVQAPSPDQAFPPPAALAHYPICKRGQFDKCMQRGGR